MKKLEINYKFPPKEYFRKIIELYINSREPKFYNPNILRGRSISISSDLEDLTALFIALNNENNCFYYTDQPIKVEGVTNKYPDILVFNKFNNTVSHLVDVKTDIGWNRNGMEEFCIDRNNRIELLKSKKFSLKEGKIKNIVNGLFNKDLVYHIIVISKINSGNQILEDINYVKNNLKNVNLYLFSDGKHPNDYKLTPTESGVDEILINESEIRRFFLNICKK